MYSRAFRALVLGFAMLGSAAAVTEPDELLPGGTTMIREGLSIRGSMFRFDAKGRFDLPDAANAPTVAGATLRVFDTGGAGGDDAYVLPAEGWTQIPAANGTGNERVRGYRFKGSPGDPCTVVLLTTRRWTPRAISPAPAPWRSRARRRPARPPTPARSPLTRRGSPECRAPALA